MIDDLRQDLTLLTRACVMCGTEETTDDGKQIYWPARKDLRIPLTDCRRCGSSALFINDSVTITVRHEDKPTFPRLRIGRPPRNRPQTD